jgi:5-methylcytosine-specific restriction endonuclease McrA
MRMSKSASGKADSGTTSPDKESTVCPTCGKSDFKNRKYMKIHHANAHGESIKGKLIECDECATTFRKEQSKIKDSEHDFCSHDCYASFRSDALTSEKNPCYRGGKSTYTCENCGKEFNRYDSQAVGDRQVCSEECQFELYTGESHEEQKQRVEVECGHCGNVVEKRLSRINRVKTAYCGKECADKGHSGEKHPNYKTGTHKDYKGKWKKQRKKARKRDDYKCQRCGVREDNLERQLDVHHKIPYRTFDDPVEANKLANLVSLCKRCHGVVESWPVIPE